MYIKPKMDKNPQLICACNLLKTNNKEGKKECVGN